MISELATKAIDAVFRGTESYCKFLSANDSGQTGGHQSGILISKTAKHMLWTEKEMKDFYMEFNYQVLHLIIKNIFWLQEITMHMSNCMILVLLILLSPKLMESNFLILITILSNIEQYLKKSLSYIIVKEINFGVFIE